MSDLPDVLDTMGRTPREFGTVQVHFEGVRVVDGKRCIATVLAQAAFTPVAQAVLQVLDQGQPIATTLLPTLDDGRVVRLHVPCVRVSEEAVLTLLVEAEEPSERASRVRPPWRLFDTFEIPKLSEMDPIRDDQSGGLDLATSIALTAVAGPLLGAVVLRVGGSATLDPNTKTTMHRARELPSLTAGVLEGVALPVEGIREEVLWRPGQPVPEAPPAVPVVRAQPPAPSGGTRWCRSCGFEGAMSEHGTARACPRCDEPWF